MKKIICGVGLYFLLASPAKAWMGGFPDIRADQYLDQTASSTSYNGGSVYAHIAAETRERNCLTDFEITISSTHAGITGAPVLFYPYTLSIIDGSLATGTTIYQVHVSTVVNTAYRVEENRSIETALCGSANNPLTISLLAPTTNYRALVNYSGYRRSNP